MGTIKKRGISLWISWVLIMMFMVSLGIMMNEWSKTYSTKQIKHFEKTILNPYECDKANLIIKSICQNEQGLLINLENKGFKIINKIKINYMINTNEFESKTIDVYLKPDQSKKVVILKNGFCNYVSVIPVINVKNQFVYCQNKEETRETIPECE